jgi:oligoribonuclease (3'-5' exoribonuclease)
VTYLFLDTETTGLDVEKHEVWEIAYAIDDGPIKSAFVPHRLTNADPKALEINGYMSRFFDLPDSSVDTEFENELIDAAQGQYLVGSNPAFDHRMLLKRWGSTPWHYRMIDVATYAMPYFGWWVPEGLARITKGLDIEENDHTAAKDVDVLRQTFYKLQSAYANEEVLL